MEEKKVRTLTGCKQCGRGYPYKELVDGLCKKCSIKKGKKLRMDDYLNHIVPLIIKGIHWGQDCIVNSDDQDKIIMDELVSFIQQEIDRAREEALRELSNEIDGAELDSYIDEHKDYFNKLGKSMLKKLSKLKEEEE